MAESGSEGRLRDAERARPAAPRRLLLVRHGETAYNSEGLFRGRADPPLTERGQRQAAAVGNALASMASPLLVVSPRRRAKATAQAIAARAGVAAVAEDARFDDLDYGDWTGLSPLRVAEQWPTAYAVWQGNPERLELPHGERVGFARDRVWSACQASVERSPLVLVVTHDVCIRMALCALLDAPLAAMHRLRIDLASITELVASSGRWVVRRANDTAHLPADLLPDAVARGA